MSSTALKLDALQIIATPVSLTRRRRRVGRANER
jgi:hypothetical protein